MDFGQSTAGLPARPGTVERAFEIARAGRCRGMSELVRMLKAERHDSVEEHLAGQSIRRDLRRAWEAVPDSNSQAQAAQGEPG